jgi:hypothetical protein
MDLTAWFGPQGVFSTGEAAHIFGSGSVPLLPSPLLLPSALPLLPSDVATRHYRRYYCR